MVNTARLWLMLLIAQCSKFMSVLYAALGIPSVISVLVTGLVISSSRRLFQKYANIFALSACELVEATSYILAAFGRAPKICNRTLFKRATVYDCFFKTCWPHALILGTELPAFCLLLASCERLMITFHPTSYSKIMEMKIRLLILVPIAGLISISAACLSAYLDGNRILDSSRFATFHFVFISFSSFASFGSFIVMGITLKGMRHTMRQESANLRRSFHSFRSASNERWLSTWLVVSGFSSFFVSLPATLMLTAMWIGGELVNNDVIVAVVYVMPG
ncbi:unnamed protein product [Cylicocyclus nassatus]|uniref:Uncharacterized protein n=1 Tax=Cylicocyclus nassatus TaxID=53992 RepID=A0AA36GFV5_CYLNA|nr:unnamed protein product [Cylicocyclus nassatus]